MNQRTTNRSRGGKTGVFIGNAAERGCLRAQSPGHGRAGHIADASRSPTRLRTAISILGGRKRAAKRKRRPIPKGSTNMVNRDSKNFGGRKGYADTARVSVTAVEREG